MKNKQIEQHLRRAVQGMAPDVYEKIASADYQHAGPIDFAEEELQMTQKNTETPRPFYRKKPFIASLSSVFAVLVLCFGFFFHIDRAVDSVIAIDVNPSIELTTNRSDKVLTVTPLNDDAAAVIGDMDLRKVDVNVAVNAIIGAMVQHGYIDEAQKSVLISVNNKDTNKAEILQASLERDVYQSLDSQNIKPVVLTQSVAIDDHMRETAHDHHISYGKAAFIQKLIDQDGSLTMEQLAPMSIQGLAKVVRDKNLSLDGIIELDYDDSLEENIADGIKDFNEYCGQCTNGCDCDDCYKYNGQCPECDRDCGHYGRNAQASTSGTAAPNKPLRTKNCVYCDETCTCEDCYEQGGCGLYCDDCNKSCKNYCQDDDRCNTPNHNHNGYGNGKGGGNGYGTGSGNGNGAPPVTTPAAPNTTKATLTKNCIYCDDSCTCKDCYEKGGCGLYCDDCSKTCKNYCQDDDRCNNPNHNHHNDDDDDRHDDDHDWDD